MPMNHSFARHESYPKPKKRPHPHDSDEPEPVQKMFISEKFANDLAAMTLNHKDENATSNHSVQYPVYEPAVPPRELRGSVTVIDNIDDFLSDDESDEANSMDTDFFLPMQKRPGEQKFHIPDFVLQDPRSPKSIQEFVLGSSYTLAAPSSSVPGRRASNDTKPKEKRIVVLNKVPPGLTMDVDDSETNGYDSNVAFMDVD